jgi:hypothetical protein
MLRKGGNGGVLLANLAGCGQQIILRCVYRDKYKSESYNFLSLQLLHKY